MRLFVYGSLRRDAEGRSHPLLADATCLGAATVRGALYKVDWYPGLVLDPEGGAVRGDLFELPPARADAMIAALDDYEGGVYRRRLATAQVEGGEALETWVYAYTGGVQGFATIPSGDFGTPMHRARP